MAIGSSVDDARRRAGGSLDVTGGEAEARETFRGSPLACGGEACSSPCAGQGSGVEQSSGAGQPSGDRSAAPLVSVIVPVWNAERTLGRCIGSLMAQSLPSLEIICVDDGSTDGSAAMLRRFAGEDPRIRVISQENRGVSAARNAGLDAARGRWVAFADSDDAVAPGTYGTLLRFDGGEDALCFSAEELVCRDGCVVRRESGYFDVGRAGPATLRDDELTSLSMTVWDKMFRREKIEAAGLRFPEGLHFEDNAFVMGFFALHRRACFVPRRLYIYFRHEGSLTHRAMERSQGLAFDYIGILDSVYAFWRRHGLFPRMQGVFERLCLDRLRSAIDICQPWERPGIAFALSSCLRGWGFEPQDESLRALRDGRLSLRLGAFPGRDITLLKPLRGWQKLFWAGRWQGRRAVRLLTFKVASWEPKERRG